MIHSMPSGVLISPVYPPDVSDLERFSHLGGVPSLPADLAWPRAPNGAPLHFLAQIDLATVPASGIVDFRGRPLPEFPREGALYFFADCATFAIWEQPEASHRVLYAPDHRGARPVQPPADLMPHNAPDAGVLANTHHPYSPRLGPRSMVLLPHVPITLTDIASVRVDPNDDSPGARFIYASWTGYELHGDWSRMPLLDTGFPWRWLLLERVAISVDATIKPDRPGDIREACIAWHHRASAENPLDKVPKAIGLEFCDWLRSLAARGESIRYYVGDSFQEAVIAGWPYIAFSGDISDFPPELVRDLHPMDRPTEGGYHKILGDAMSVQEVQLADESHVLLLRLDSDYTLDFCWGDVGVLQITVSRDDLAARNFARTHLNADCY